MKIIPTLSLSLLAGCMTVGNVDEDNFASKSGQVWCKQMQKCYRGYFESEYSDMEDCMDEIEEDIEDQMDAADDAGCDFEEDGAQDCLDTFAESDCEDYYEGDAWDDCETDDIYDCDSSSSSGGLGGGE